MSNTKRDASDKLAEALWAVLVLIFMFSLLVVLKVFP